MNYPVIVCVRRTGRPPQPAICGECNRRPATVQCDFPDSKNPSGACDRFLCIDPRCCLHIPGERGGADKDFCRTHNIGMEPLPA